MHVQTLQELLLKAACGKDYVSKLQFVTTFYGEDINSSVLQVQLELFNTYLNSKEFNNDGSFTILQIRDCFVNCHQLQGLVCQKLLQF